MMVLSVASWASVLLMDDMMLRNRTMAMMIQIWKPMPTVFAFPRGLSLAFLCLDFVASVIIHLSSTVLHGDEFPSRVYCQLLVWTITYICIACVVQLRLSSMYGAQQDLKSEKEAADSLLSMVCDAALTLSHDGDTIVRCDQRFNQLMDRSMSGATISSCLPGGMGGVERGRLQMFLANCRPGAAMLFHTTMAKVSGSVFDVEFFVVDRRASKSSFSSLRICGGPSGKVGYHRPGFLVGVRLSSQQTCSDMKLLDDEQMQAAVSAQSAGSVSVCLDEHVAIHAGLLAELERSEVSEASLPLNKPGRGGSLGGRSAPAAMVSSHHRVSDALPHSKESKDGCGSGDCLPANAVVWVEGEQVPRELSQVVPGQRVLCSDSLTGGMKYAEVLTSRLLESQDIDWVAVALEDGTSLTMTADHPVMPVSATKEVWEPNVTRDSRPFLAVPASRLEPGKHAIYVLKLLPVPVLRVDSAGASEAVPQARVNLTVRQPERHAVFVAQAKVGPGFGPPTPMAVGSADLSMCSPQMLQPEVRVKNTFIEACDAASDISLCQSAPPTMTVHQREVHCVSDGLRSVVDDASSCLSLASSVSESVMTKSSAMSSVTFRLAGACSPSAGVDGHASLESENAMLTNFLNMQNCGLNSFGAFRHANNQCKVCPFESMYNAGLKERQCRFGAFCDLCHNDHKGRIRQRRGHFKRSLCNDEPRCATMTEA